MMLERNRSECEEYGDTINWTSFSNSRLMGEIKTKHEIDEFSENAKKNLFVWLLSIETIGKIGVFGLKWNKTQL